MANKGFLSVIDIIWEARKLPAKNKKIFIFITLSTIISYFLLYFADILSLILLISNLSANVLPLLYHSIDPTSPDYLNKVLKIQEKIIPLLLVGTFYTFLMSMVSLLSTVSTIYVSAMSYLGKNLTLKELLSKIKQIWVRPLITWFSLFLITAGLLLLYLSLFLLVVFGRGSVTIVALGVVLILIVAAINQYIVLVSIMSLVVSVLEDCYGFQALGKAEKLIKERKMVGFVLSLLLDLPSIVVSFCVVFSNNLSSMTIRLLIACAAIILGILLNMLRAMAYTVFYFDCKESNGEQIDLEDEMQYSRISTMPIVSLALP